MKTIETLIAELWMCDHEQFNEREGAVRSYMEDIKRQARAEALEEAIAAVPGGSICDPQQVADAIRALIGSPASSGEVAEGLNGGMHASNFVKVWGDAGGGDAGRIALAKYAYELGRRSALASPTSPVGGGSQ